MENPRYIIPDSHYDDQLDMLRYSNITAHTWINDPPPKSEPYKEGYLDAASHYKYELKMLLNAIERADITVGCRSDKFQLAIDRARKAADEPLNQIQPEEEIF
jgi:hypothetical protein